MREINFTIAVAVYNVEKYLEECLESVLAQEGEDVEILLTDDGSTDASGAICDACARKDRRVKVIHKENGGLSSVRNVGIDRASGRWIVFVDGDDTLTEDALAIMRCYQDSDADLVNFAFKAGNAGPDEGAGPGSMSLGPMSPGLEISGDEVTAYRLGQLFAGYRGNSVVNSWGRMWNRKYLERLGLRFDLELRKAQDVAFSFASSRNMRKILCDPREIYRYRINEQAISWRFSANILQMQTVYMTHLWDDMEAHGESGDVSYVKEYLKRCVFEYWQTLARGIMHPDCHWNPKEGERWLSELENTEWVQRALNGLPVLDGSIKKAYRDAWVYMMRGDMKAMERWCRKTRLLQRGKRRARAVLRRSRWGAGVLETYRRRKGKGRR